MSMSPTLTLSEELLLLAVDDDKGKISMNASAALDYGLAGGQLLELALAERVSLDGKKVVILDGELTGDDLIDAAFARMIAEKKPRSVAWWVNALHGKTRRHYLERLVARDIVGVETHKVLGLIPVTRHPEKAPEAEREIRGRLRGVGLDGAEPDSRTAALVGLVFACGLVPAVFPDRVERKVAKPRLAKIAEGQAVSQAVTAVINQINAAVTAAIVASTVASTSGT